MIFLVTYGHTRNWQGPNSLITARECVRLHLCLSLCLSVFLCFSRSNFRTFWPRIFILLYIIFRSIYILRHCVKIKATTAKNVCLSVLLDSGFSFWMHWSANFTFGTPIHLRNHRPMNINIGLCSKHLRDGREYQSRSRGQGQGHTKVTKYTFCLRLKCNLVLNCIRWC